MSAAVLRNKEVARSRGPSCPFFTLLTHQLRGWAVSCPNVTTRSFALQKPRSSFPDWSKWVFNVREPIHPLRFLSFPFFFLLSRKGCENCKWSYKLIFYDFQNGVEERKIASTINPVYWKIWLWDCEADNLAFVFKFNMIFLDL